MKKFIFVIVLAIVSMLEVHMSFAENFGGIGIQIKMKTFYYDNFTLPVPVVIYVMPGTPASENGIKPGDIILLVDGELVLARTSEFFVSQIRGPVNSTVKLKILRLTENIFLDLILTRAEIQNTAYQQSGIERGNYGQGIGSGLTNTPQQPSGSTQDSVMDKVAETVAREALLKACEKILAECDRISWPLNEGCKTAAKMNPPCSEAYK